MKSSSRIIFFLTLAAMPAGLAAAQDDENLDFAAQKAAVGQALDMAVEMMFKPGALDPNWNRNAPLESKTWTRLFPPSPTTIRSRLSTARPAGWLN